MKYKSFKLSNKHGHREVGGSNPGKSLSFSPGRRLDLPILLDEMNNSGVTHYSKKKKEFEKLTSFITINEGDPKTKFLRLYNNATSSII